MKIDQGGIYECRNGIEVEIFDQSSIYAYGIIIEPSKPKQGGYWFLDTGQYGPAEKKQDHELDIVQLIMGDFD